MWNSRLILENLQKFAVSSVHNWSKIVKMFSVWRANRSIFQSYYFKLPQLMLILEYTQGIVLPWPTACESLNTSKEQSFPLNIIVFCISPSVLALL